MTSREQVFSSDGVTMHYWTVGKGKPLLFLSGGVRALTYQKNVELLAKHFQVIISDLPGFGKSSVPKEIWNLDRYADYFEKFIGSLGIDNFPIVGHSLGGGIGLALAIRSEKISQLILVGSAGVASTVRPWKFYLRVAFTKSLYDLIHAKNYKIQAIIFSNGILTLRTVVFGARRLIQIINRCVFHTYPHLEQVAVPVTLLWGNEDELFPYQDCAITLQRLLPNATLTAVPGNHDWCLLEPEQFMNEILATLTS